MPRCPNGTRKNKQGDCVSHKKRETQKKKRCPNGTRKNKKGDCVSVSNTPKTKKEKIILAKFYDISNKIDPKYKKKRIRNYEQEGIPRKNKSIYK